MLRLEWQVDKRMVLVEVEKKPEMPNVCLIPVEQISVITPLAEKPALEGVRAGSFAGDQALQAHREKMEAKQAEAPPNTTDNPVPFLKKAIEDAKAADKAKAKPKKKRGRPKRK